MKSKKKYNKGGKVDPPKITANMLKYLKDWAAKQPSRSKDFGKALDDLGSEKLGVSSSNFDSTEYYRAVDNDGEGKLFVRPFTGRKGYMNDEMGATKVYISNKYGRPSSGSVGEKDYSDEFELERNQQRGGEQLIIPSDFLKRNILKLNKKSGNLSPENNMKLVDPFPKVYGRKMDASGTKAIYNTSKGKITKKKGKGAGEDAEFIKLMRRLNRNYR